MTRKLMFLATLIILATGAYKSEARVKPIEFIDEITTKPQHESIASNRLCSTKDVEGGVSKENKVSVRNFLGPKLKSITITEVRSTIGETHDKFGAAKGHLIDLFAKSPRSIFRYEPWANAIQADIVGRINYLDGKSGEFRCADGYLCLQDHDGKHWWMRMTSPSDLNQVPVE